jgi:3'-5' exoribonuclease
MATGGTISSLREGEEVRGIYACVRKDRLKTRTGSPYLALELRDRTGSVQARAFRDADVLGGRFERGDLVSVVGRVERFREQLTVEVTDIRRAEAKTNAGSEAQTVVLGASSAGTDLGEAPTVVGQAEPETAALQDFLPVAYRDLDELDGFLEHLSSEVYDPGYKLLLDSILQDAQLRAALRQSPCTRNGHHAYLGGLLEHTVAVATLARETCDLHRRLNSDLLITAAIVHDIGRTREFSYGAEIGLSDEGRLLGHLVLGQQILNERFARLEASRTGVQLDQPRRLALLNCVLSHHGPSSAPGGRFSTPEALALFRINAVDAGVKGVLEHGFGGPGSDS